MKSAALTIILLCAGTLAAETDGLIASPEKGFPQWRGLRRDGISGETNLLASWPVEGPKILWKNSDMGRGWSSPIIAGESIFITGDVAGELVIFCLDLEGKLKWKTANGSAFQGDYPGARSTCAYSDGVVYHMNAFGRVVALDASSGKELWNLNVLKHFESLNITWGMSECLLIDGPRLIVTPSGPKTLMAALDKKDGKTIWMSEGVVGEKASYSSPILFRMGNRRLISNVSSTRAFGVDADSGKLLWTVPIKSRHGALCNSPVYSDGHIFYGTPDSTAGVLYKLNATDTGVSASLVWSTPVDPLTSTGLYLDGRLYVNGCYKARELHCLDWQTGKSLYNLRLFPGKSPFSSAALIWAEQRLYCLSEDGTLSLLKPTADKFEVAGQFQWVESKDKDAWAHPVLLDGRLYVRFHEGLWCYDVKAK